jgi:hypothetical protein
MHVLIWIQENEKKVMNIVIETNEELLRNNSSTPDLTSMFVFIEHDADTYPCKGWIDNPSIVLGWWLHSFNDIISGGKGQGVNFMEGPYFINTKCNNGILELVSEDGEFSCQISLMDFGVQLSKAMNRASRIFHKMGMKQISEGFDKEVAALKKVLLKLSEEQ